MKPVNLRGAIASPGWIFATWLLMLFAPALLFACMAYLMSVGGYHEARWWQVPGRGWEIAWLVGVLVVPLVIDRLRRSRDDPAWVWRGRQAQRSTSAHYRQATPLTSAIAPGAVARACQHYLVRLALIMVFHAAAAGRPPQYAARLQVHGGADHLDPAAGFSVGGTGGTAHAMHPLSCAHPAAHHCGQRYFQESTSLPQSLRHQTSRCVAAARRGGYGRPMSKVPPVPFGKEHAQRYDQTFAKLAPFKDALHIATRGVLFGLPDNAHILCAGAGTGAELLYLAREFPGWRFTALDLSEPMLEVCRQRAQAAGMLARCRFHVGAVSSLDTTSEFDAATSILVSQFITDIDARRAFFRTIASRLRPSGILVTADLTCDLADDHSQPILDLWRHTLAYAHDKPPAELDGAMAALGNAVAPLPEAQYSALLQSAGFSRPTRYFQAVLIQAWFTQRAAQAG